MRNKLTQDAPTLFRDQYGHAFVASSRAELCRIVRAKLGVIGKVSKQYVDKRAAYPHSMKGVSSTVREQRAVWNGYVLGAHWFTAFKWCEVDVS